MHGKRVRKGLKLSVLAALMVLIMGMTAYAAHQIPDMTKDGEGVISVDMEYSHEAVPGGEMAIYQVAEMKQVNGNYYFFVIDPFTGIDDDVKAEIDGQDPDHFTDTLWRELAQELADYACDPENNVTPLAKDNIGNDGNVTFSGLNFGLYLLIQTEPVEGYYAANPFLVSIPKYEGTEEDGEYTYRVDAFPKTELYPGPDKKVYTDGDVEREDDDDGADVYIGDTLTYKIDYENNKYETVTITITDELDERIDFVSASDDGIYDEDSRTITWVIEGVEHGEKGYVTFTTTVNDKAMERNEVENTAKVQVGENSSFVDTNTVHNPRREYFQIDEEIVTDTENIFRTSDWVKDESVTEYYDIEMEMTTLLPVIEGEELVGTTFTMNFHEFLDEELALDTNTADFTVYLRGNTSSPINLNDEEYLDENGDPKYYYIEFPEEECTYPGEEPNLCAFHVIVDLSALYEDHIIDDSDLQGETWITIFFHADLEEDAAGDALYGSYTSTVWYEVWSGDQAVLEHTSNQSVVTVYTYEISIIKYNSSRLRNNDYAAAALAGATLGIYTDADCTIPVTRKGEAYTVTSGSDGSVVFFGLAGGTYYVKEISAPNGYVLSSTVLTVNLRSLDDEVYVYEGTYANRPRTTGGGGGSSGGGGGSSGGGGGSGSGGPGDGASEGEGDSVWDLLPLPQTGQGWAMLIAVCAMIAAGIGLIVAHVVRRKN